MEQGRIVFVHGGEALADCADLDKHNGTYVEIMDWEKNKTVRFMDLIG